MFQKSAPTLNTQSTWQANSRSSMNYLFVCAGGNQECIVHEYFRACSAYITYFQALKGFFVSPRLPSLGSIHPFVGPSAPFRNSNPNSTSDAAVALTVQYIVEFHGRAPVAIHFRSKFFAPEQIEHVYDGAQAFKVVVIVYALYLYIVQTFR
jgi:hypothetical protein